MKILLIEDDAEIVEFITLAFEVGWAGSSVISTHHGNEGIDLVEKESPEVVLLDIGLPDISGYEVLRQIRLFSQVPVIVITVRDSEQEIVKGLNLGADEYVSKPFGQLEMLARVRAVLRRHRGEEAGGPITRGPLQLDPVSDSVICGATKVHLTRTEAMIMGRLMKNEGNVVTYHDLAETVWGETYPNAADTLRVYVRRLRTKIESIPQCRVSIRSKPAVGYALEIVSNSPVKSL